MLALPFNNDSCASVLLGNWAWTFREQVQKPCQRLLKTIITVNYFVLYTVIFLSSALLILIYTIDLVCTENCCA